ncbi:sensor histidine kinase [Myroides odoratus]|uniref:sensor histidine kinase n=1 Tax=Myroides odoratus TaxID=256 RepID=UPI0039AEAFF4
MAVTFNSIASLLYSNHVLSIEPWKDPLNLFIWFIYALLIVSGISYSSIYLLKKNHRNEIKRKQQVEQIEKTHLKVLIQKHIETQEDERIRIGSDLHDTISNKLSLILLKLNLGYSVEQVESDIKETLLTVRDISHNLNPPFYKDTPLPVLLLNQLEKVIPKYTLHKWVSLHRQKDWSANFKMQLIRIVQELITNIVKHAKATEIKMELRESQKGIYFSLEDNGIGFLGNTKGLGYQSIQNRLFLINGQFKIKSKINCGTKIIVLVQNEI